MKEDELIVGDEFVIGKIFFIRGLKVMLDKDLAELYDVETKVLKQAVKRNLKRFPEDFMFELSKPEFDILRSQFVTSSSGWGGDRYLPMAFSEQGVAMLSSVLKSDRAISVNIQIMRIFTRLRQSLSDTTELRLALAEIKQKTDNNSKNIEIVFTYLDELLDKREKAEPRKTIGYSVAHDS